MDESPYQVFRWAGRDLLAVPKGRDRILAATIDRFGPSLRRPWLVRALFRNAIRWMGAGGIVETRAAPVPGMPGWDAYRTAVEQSLGRSGLEFVVVFPPQADRGRVYVHVFEPSGVALAFGKVSTSDRSDRELQHEGRALANSEPTSSYRRPKLLMSGSVAGRHHLLLESLPPGAKPVAPHWTDRLQQIHGEIHGADRELSRVASTSWWSSFADKASDAPALSQYLRASEGESTFVGRAHGDFVHWNIHHVDGQYWVVDWESAADDAPALTDRVRFFLGVHTRAAQRDPRQVARELGELFRGEGMPPTKLRLARALAFLHARGVVAATAVGRVWEEVERGLSDG